jgi:nicotinate-nucleotide pyrophosphorylase (carboxylating)
MSAALPPWLVIDPLLAAWLREDIGRGDRTTQGLSLSGTGKAQWLAKEAGIVAGLPLAARVFYLIDQQVTFVPLVAEGEAVTPGQAIADIVASLEALLMGERVALNLGMRLSGIATLTRRYVETIADYHAQLVDTRKTTPGLRILEKYATQVGGAVSHRLGLDDAVMLKDNHIQAAGGITPALAQLRGQIPYPLKIEVETTTLAEVAEAIAGGAEIIMLDNLNLREMGEAVALIRQKAPAVQIEASGNITLETIRAVAETGVDYISSSAPITRSTWLDLSMRLTSVKKSG